LIRPKNRNRKQRSALVAFCIDALKGKVDFRCGGVACSRFS